MTIKIDPEQNETEALFGFVDFTDQKVLEIGCGDGRLTRHYAVRAGHVTAIDRFADGIARARGSLQHDLESRVEFHAIAFEDFAASHMSRAFDTVIFSWSL